MNVLLWVIQIAGALLFAASGIMKLFMFDKISHDVPSFGALPRGVWKSLGALELLSDLGLIIPTAFHWHPALSAYAALFFAIESLLFIWVHVKYRELPPIVFSLVLGALMGLLAYGRLLIVPIAG